MKKIFIKLSLILGLATSANAQQIGQVPTNCTDLFITELTFGKNPEANNTFDLNYAIEIFNSSSSPVNLSNYSIDLTTPAGIVTSIPLSGTLASHDVYVVGNSNADLNLQGLCDQLSSNLDFELNVSLELKKGTTVLDKLGIGGNTTPQNFDVAQLLADPYNYLLNFHLDLNDYHNIDIRRSMLAQHGFPNFNASTDILGQWWYTANVDRSDIGSYVGVCNKPLGMDIVGYWTPYSVIDYPGYNNDFLDFNVNNSKNGILTSTGITFKHTELTSSTGDVCNDGSIINPPLTFDPSTNSVNALNTYCKGVDINYPNNGSNSGSKLIATGSSSIGVNCDFLLTTNTSSIQLDPASINHRTHVDHSVGIKSIVKNNLNAKVYPTITNSYLNIDCKENISYSIFNSLGQIILAANNQGNFKIDVSNLSESLYYIELKSKDGLTLYSKFTKN
jgi:Secretion system C-terminal sorting domain